MMLGEVLLAQFVLCCNSFFHIACRPHCIHKMRIPYACICRWVYVLVYVCCLTLTAKVLQLQPANLSSAAHLEPVFMYKGAQVILFSFERGCS